VKSIEPAKMGVVWRRILVMSRDAHMYTDRDSKDRGSFTFKEQTLMVADSEAHHVLDMLDQSE